MASLASAFNIADMAVLAGRALPLPIRDYLEGGADNDIYMLDSGGASRDHIFDVGGNDTVNYKASLEGANVVLGDSQREALFTPTSVTIHASPTGYLFPGTSVAYGVIIGIENIDGTDFDDIFIGSDDINKINGGAGNDQIRGLGGDDILLGGDGDDILIGDGGDDYLSGGAGFNIYIGGLGNDTIDDISQSFSVVKYSVGEEGDNQ